MELSAMQSNLKIITSLVNQFLNIELNTTLKIFEKSLHLYRASLTDSQVLLVVLYEVQV